VFDWERLRIEMKKSIYSILHYMINREVEITLKITGCYIGEGFCMFVDLITYALPLGIYTILVTCDHMDFLGKE